MRFQVGKSSCSIDPLRALDDLERMQSQHRLSEQSQKDFRGFLVRVAFWLQSKGLEGATTTVAYQFWQIIRLWVETHAKEHQLDAELAFWFHVDPWKLDQKRKAGLIGNLPRVQAQQSLQQGNYDPLDYSGIEALVLLATGNEHEARRRMRIAKEAYVDAKMASKR